jgi:hypothetical protein
MKKTIFATIFALFSIIGSPSFADTPNLSDTETARIDLVSLSNRNIEVSNSSSELLATITASDNLNNIAEVYFGIYRAASPFATQVNLFPLQTSTKPITTSVVNGRVVSVFQFKITIPKGLASGDYYIYTFAKDAAGNYPQTGPCDKYCNPAEMPKYPESTFKVKNDSTGQVIDVTQFDLTSKMKILQDKYDLLVDANNALATDYKNLLLVNKTLTATYETEIVAKAKLSADLKVSQTAVLDSDKKLKLAEETKQIALSDALSLRSEMGSLNANIKGLQSQLSVANKKLSAICKAKPKPKGC